MQSYNSISQDSVGDSTDDNPIRIIEQEYNEEEIPRARMTSSLINILNTILGSGMLAMPYAFKNYGIIPGAIFLIWSGFCSFLGLFLCVRSAEFVGRRSSFNSISKLTFPGGSVAFDMAVGIKCFGVALSYLIIIGDLMPEVVKGLFSVSDGLLIERRFWITLSIAILIPISFLRRLDSLKYTSLIALGSILYLYVLTIYYFAEPESKHADDVKLIGISGGALGALSIFIFAFTCHQNIFTVYNEIVDNSRRSMNTVLLSSIFVALTLYLSMGILGYIMYGDKAEGNILTNFGDTPAVIVAKFSISILNLFSYPLQCHPSRISFLNVIEHFKASGSSYRLLETGQKNSKSFYLITVLFLGLSFTIAFFVSSLGSVLKVVGATGSTTISYILPGFFYYKITADRPLKGLRLMALLLGVYGIILMPTLLIAIFVG
jgi:amino acid permease